MSQNISAFLRLMRELQKIDPEFPLQYAVCLGEIALEEGLSLTRLSEKTGMPLSTISRIVGALSRRRQQGAPYDLVRVAIAPQERRKKQIFLTPRGRAFIASIGELMPGPAAPSGQLRA
jgi:DNA-binding MarR family transcriptional regulator